MALVTHAVTGEGRQLLAITESSAVVHLGGGRDLDVTRRPSPVPVADITSVALANADSPRDSFALALVRVNGQERLRFFPSLDLDGGVNLPVPDGDQLRNATRRIGVLRLEPDGGTRSPAALEFRPGPPMPPDASLDFAEALGDGGFAPRQVLDVRYLPPTGVPLASDDRLLLTREGLFLARVTGEARRLTGAEESLPSQLSHPLVPEPHPHLRHDPTGTLAAFTILAGSSANVLSTWRLDRGPSPSAVRAWSDCAPCAGRIAAFAPALESGAPEVEVLCASPSGPPGSRSVLSLVRVTGSSAADERQACAIEPLAAPFPLAQVNELSRGRRAAEGFPAQVVFDETFGTGVVLGGRRGQLWAGATFSRALPVFLERVPLAFGALPTPDGGSVPAVLTDLYTAVPRNPALGYEVLDLRIGAALPAGTVGAAFIGQALGWGVTSSADLIFLDPFADAGDVLTFGPRLLDARGAPARGPFFGEAVTAADGGLVSFVITADDSLYFAPAPARGTTTATPSVLDPLTPQLTPAPSSPIRSFALERSAVGTDGVTRVRGYVVAGRSLFVVTLSGAPPRWTATPILLQGGEPIEAWMDHPLGGLGRVGYRDGQVFTLPGGFQLVNELPRDAGANPPQVLDYENLGGWPVAMTSNGLFEAHYPVLESGFLDNRFEDGGINRAMSWALVTLPDGGQPWLGRPSRLHVTQTVEPYDPASGLLRDPVPARVKVFRLLVYTDDQVIEVGTLVRR